METDEARSIEKTTSAEAEWAEGSPYSVNLRDLRCTHTDAALHKHGSLLEKYSPANFHACARQR
eukprot:8044847-Karenia_brevis.AAC.1